MKIQFAVISLLTGKFYPDPEDPQTITYMAGIVAKEIDAPAPQTIAIKEWANFYKSKIAKKFPKLTQVAETWQHTNEWAEIINNLKVS